MTIISNRRSGDMSTFNDGLEAAALLLETRAATFERSALEADRREHGRNQKTVNVQTSVQYTGTARQLRLLASEIRRRKV